MLCYVIIITMCYHRRTIRLNGFDYSNNGYYFVTICTKNRKNIFGEIVGARRDSPFNKNEILKIKLNKNGKIVNDIWKTLPDHNNVILDEFCIMPNHVHFVLGINNNQLKQNDLIKINDGVLGNGALDNKCGVIGNENGAMGINNKGESRLAPTTTQLGLVIGMFKTECTKQINKLNKTPGIQLFQRNYYEHIIRNEKEYLRIKEYIRLNPEMWWRDRNNLEGDLKI